MTRWTRWTNGLWFCGMASLTATGCLEEDPNMDGITSMTGGPTGGSVDSSNTGNGPGGTIDDTGIEPTGANTQNPPTGDIPTGTTIYDVQMGVIAPETVVTLENVLISTPVRINETDDGVNGDVFIQDASGGPNSGIRLYLFSEVVMGVPLNPGDVVTITGQYQEFFDESQISVASADDIQVTGTGTLPAPIAVAPTDVVAGSDQAEQYEGVPVCLSDVTASDATNQFGDFHVDANMAVTNLFLFGSDDFLDVLPGTEFASLCGPIAYSFEEYKVAPRNADDFSATLVGCTDGAPVTTIGELQQGAFDEGDLIQVVDVVITTPWNFDQELFWVQDPAGGAYSGISVYFPESAGFVPSPGDVVTVCGEYDEFFDQSQIQVSAAANIVPNGNAPVPAAEVLTADQIGTGAMAEQWEGVLVQVEDVTVSAAADMFGEWIVDDVLRLTPEFFDQADWPTPAVDTALGSLTGVLTYSFENYKLAPRTAADIVP